MARTLVTSENLAEWMTAELRKVEDCGDCGVGDVNRLQQPDADGCNWSDSLTVRSGGVPLEYFRPHLEKIVARARAEFNLEDGT